MSDWQGFEQQQAAPAGRGRGRVLVGTLGVLLLLAGIAAAVNWLVPIRQQVAPGTTVAGVDVGGMSRGQVQAAVRGPVTDAVGATVTLTAGDGTVEVKPADAGFAVDGAATEEELLATGPTSLLERWQQDRDPSGPQLDPVVTVDEARATAYLGELLKPLNREARNATITAPAPAPVMTAQGNAAWSPRPVAVQVGDSQSGQKIDTAAALAAVRDAVANLRTEAEVDAQVTEPSLSTEEARRVDQLIGTFTTMHPCCAPRVTNIHRIAEIVNGTLLMPGDEFSLNEKAGRRTKENGFVDAPAIAEGEHVDQVGGGVSQFSTTLYNATWFAGIDLITHAPHSEYFSRYPPGREATLDYDTIDQKFSNDTDAPILVRTATTGTSVTVALYGHTGDREVVSTTGARSPRDDGGFSVVVTRSVRDGGREVSTKEARATYRGAS